MNWKKIIAIAFGLLSFLLLAIVVIYFFSHDLGKNHSKHINSLQEFEEFGTDGSYRLKTNDLEFHIRVAGLKNEGQGILMLHGFPESSILWQSLMEEANTIGYKVVAFDQRGYSPGARPKKITNYHVDELVGDVLAVAEEIGFDSFHLVGHDWGSAVGWKTTMDYPERIISWSALSVGHVGVFFDGIINNAAQKESSGYMHKLRMPILPELMLQLFRKRLLGNLEGIWTTEQIAESNKILAERGACTAMLNWYRAIDFSDEGIQDYKTKLVTRPTLYIWGKDDPVIAPEIIPEQKKLITAPYKEIKLDCGHSVMQEKTDVVIEAILDHIKQAEE